MLLLNYAVRQSYSVWGLIIALKIPKYDCDFSNFKRKIRARNLKIGPFYFKDFSLSEIGTYA